MGLKGRLKRLERAPKGRRDEITRGLDSSESIRKAAQHANACARDEGPIFEITEGGEVLCTVDAKPVTTWIQTGAERFYWMQMEWVAHNLLSGVEPELTLDEKGAFWTQDGRFALSRVRQDLSALMGPHTQKQIEATPLGRWREFLKTDERAAGILKRLLEMADNADVPDEYRMPNHHWHELGEINDRLGNHDLGSIFGDAEEREATRRLTWTLTYERAARAMLSELTSRRDRFVAGTEVAEEGEGVRS